MFPSHWAGTSWIAMSSCMTGALESPCGCRTGSRPMYICEPAWRGLGGATDAHTLLDFPLGLPCGFVGDICKVS